MYRGTSELRPPIGPPWGSVVVKHLPDMLEVDGSFPDHVKQKTFKLEVVPFV